MSNDDAAAHARDAGAAHTIDRKREDVVQRVMEITGGKGVDRVIEVDFGANCMTDIAMLKVNGTIASYSSTSEPRPTFPYYAFANKGANLRVVQGFAIPERERLRGEAMLAELAEAGKLKAAIAHAYPLAEIAAAHLQVERGGNLGNVVVLLP